MVSQQSYKSKKATVLLRIFTTIFNMSHAVICMLYGVLWSVTMVTLMDLYVGVLVTACPEGKYSSNCDLTCDCADNALCDPVSGRCQCGMGHMGERCDDPCPSGKYGPNCQQTCLCQNGAECDKVTGCCSCGLGWYGQQCDLGE